MRKILSIISITAFLALPIISSASYVDTYDMNIDASTLVWNNYYADYDAKINPLGGINEVFCVENAPMNGKNVPYDFYTIDNSLAGYGVSASWIASLQEASWYANWFVNSGQTEQNKKTAQVAIWNAIGFAGDAANSLWNLYDSANDKDAYTSNWLFAVNPSNGGKSITIGEPGQNYLVATATHMPEPATMMLFGMGLLGLAGVGRRKK